MGSEGIIGRLEGGKGSSFYGGDGSGRREGRAEASTINDGVRGDEGDSHLGIVFGKMISHLFATEVAATLQEGCETLPLGLEERFEDLNVHIDDFRLSVACKVCKVAYCEIV